MQTIEESMSQLLEYAKKNRKMFNLIKKAAVTGQMFDVAAKLREIEKEAFPETQEVQNAKEQAKQLNLVFRMIDLKVEEPLCWLIAETIKLKNEKGGNFSIEDATKLLLKKQELFETE